MKKLIFSGVVCLMAFAILSNVSAFAYIINGDLTDWGDGVSPFSDWDPGSGTTIDWIERDNLRGNSGGVTPWGGEPYDVEALYFDDDGEYFYFAMVSSYPLSDDLAGDLAISFSAQAGYEYGIKIKGMATPTVVDESYELNPELRKNPRWYTCGTTDANPIYMQSGEYAGDAEIFYKNAGDIEGPYTTTYILEARISRFLFDPLSLEGTPIFLHWAEKCGNDFITLEGEIDHPPIPEPASLLLVAMGLLGLGGARYKKIRKN